MNNTGITKGSVRAGNYYILFTILTTFHILNVPSAFIKYRSKSFLLGTVTF